MLKYLLHMPFDVIGHAKIVHVRIGTTREVFIVTREVWPQQVYMEPVVYMSVP